MSLVVKHTPVMLSEVLEHFAPAPGQHFLDATFGGGGHTRAILESGEAVRVTALDRDPSAGERAAALQAEFPQTLRFFDTNFGDLARIPLEPLDGALFDLGVSSFQLDEAERGFSFRAEAPLDLRMDPRKGQPASAFLETADREEIVEAVRDLGEEPRWRQVVSLLLRLRGTGELATTTRLARCLETALSRPVRGKPSRIHPATRTFQGIRIAVNRELTEISDALPVAFEKLKPGGRLAVISFHSLEDRIVKRLFRKWAGRPEHRLDSRTQDEREVLGTLIGASPMKPTEEEIATNPRSRSARLRIIEKLPAQAK